MKRAYLIGINEHRHIPRLNLRTAVNDARELGRLLGQDHGYEVGVLTDDVTKDGMLRLLDAMVAANGEDDRVVLYFAGHGIAPDERSGRSGYLVPGDVRPGAGVRDSLLLMDDFYAKVEKLRCRHLLLVLDCCYAGAFRWAKVRQERGLDPVPEGVMYRERFEVFRKGVAWQLVTSAAHDQKALDVFMAVPLGERGEDAGGHSPFAAALLRGLRGEADAKGEEGRGDGVITAAELQLFVETTVSTGTWAAQSVELWPMERHDKGQYLFLVPGLGLDEDKARDRLPPVRELSKAANPYRGLAPYEFTTEHGQLFFGREEAVGELEAKVKEEPLTVVVGPSGSGKSSLVKAGLLIRLQKEGWEVLPPLRVGSAPVKELETVLSGLVQAHEDVVSRGNVPEAVSTWRRQNPGRKLALCIDQFEELLAPGITEEERLGYARMLAQCCEAHGEELRIVLTLRGDFEPRVKSLPGLEPRWEKARHTVAPLTVEELRQAILGPAIRRVLFFDPPKLVDALVGEVVNSAGALPLLSFTLSELYFKCVERGNPADRRLREDEFLKMGRVMGSLSLRADQVYLGGENVDTATAQGAAAHQESPRQQMLRHVMLRMVEVRGTEVVKRRLPLTELEYEKEEWTRLARTAVNELLEARLIVADAMALEDGASMEYVEPAHEVLLRGWARLSKWLEEERRTGLGLTQMRRLTDDAGHWLLHPHEELLWDHDAHLEDARKANAEQPLRMNRAERAFLLESERVRLRDRRRRWSLVVGAMGVITVLLVAASFGWWRVTVINKDLETKTGEAKQSAEAATRAATESASRLAASEFAESAVAYEKDLNFDRALAMAALAVSEAPVADPRLKAYVKRATYLAATGPLRVIPVGRPITGAVFNPMGDTAVAVIDTGSIRSFDLATGALLPSPLRQGGGLDSPTIFWNNICYSPDGKEVAALLDEPSGDGASKIFLRVWDAHSGATRVHTEAPKEADEYEGFEAGHLTYSTDGRWITVIFPRKQSSMLYVWDAKTGKSLHELGAIATAASVEDDPLLFPLTVREGRCLTITISQRTDKAKARINVVDVESAMTRASLEVDGRVEGTRLSDDGIGVAYITNLSWGNARLGWWIIDSSVHGETPLSEVEHFTELTPNGRSIVTLLFGKEGSENATELSFWEIRDGTPVLAGTARVGGVVRRLAMSGSQELHIGSTNAQYQWSYWRVDPHTRVNSQFMATSEVPAARFWPVAMRALQIYPMTGIVWTAEGEGVLRKFDANLPGPDASFELKVAGGVVEAAEFSLDRQRVALLTGTSAIARDWQRMSLSLHDTSTGRQLWLAPKAARLSTLSFSADGTRLASGAWPDDYEESRGREFSDGGRVAPFQTVDTATGSRTALISPDSPLSHIALSAEGQRFIGYTSETDPRLLEWNTATGSVYSGATKLGENAFSFLAFSRDGAYFATEMEHSFAFRGLRLCRVIDPKGRAETLVFGDPRASALTLGIFANSPGCKCSVPGDSEKMVVRNGRTTIGRPSSGTGSLRFNFVLPARAQLELTSTVLTSEDGDLLATGTDDDQLGIWETASGMPIAAWPIPATRRLSYALNKEGTVLLLATKDLRLMHFAIGPGTRTVWFAKMGPALSGLRRAANGTLERVPLLEHPRLFDDFIAELKAAAGAGDPDAQLLWKRFGP